MKIFYFAMSLGAFFMCFLILFTPFIPIKSVWAEIFCFSMWFAAGVLGFYAFLTTPRKSHG
jgi:hypothetical protein